MTQETATLPLAQSGTERKPWPRILRLSLTDLFLVIMIFWLFMADPMGWDRLLWDGDTALHIRTGDFILDHGYVPTQDPFSFTQPGGHWVAFQWLSGVVLAVANRAAGLKGVVLLCGAVIALYLALLACDMVKRGTNGLIALLLVMVGANASAIHFHARPHLFTLLFLVIAGALVARDREQPSWRIWVLAPLAALWANMHSAFPVLFALVGLLVAGCALSQDWPRARRYAIVLGVCVAVTLLNPNGSGLHLHIAEFLNNKWAMENINEYQSPVFRSEAMTCYMGLLFLALMACGRYFARRQWTECLWILCFAAGSLTSARHIPLFIVVTLPLTGTVLSELWLELTRSLPATSALGVLGGMSANLASKLQPLSVWSAVAIAVIALLPQQWPKDLSAKYFPRAVVHQFAGQLTEARVFTTDQWGDYLLWTGYPKQRIFIDGRSDFFGEKIGRDYATIMNAAPGWREALKRYGVNMALLPPETPLVELLAREAGWRVLDRERDAVLLAKP
ncbi:MAG TPA: hypothetical protein VMH80_22635 [Bryobacteraceae bacterium]|nr:hypothetical protein [Bryobacteraceae bacterium]